VVRIDPRTNRVSGPPIRVGTGAGQGVAGFGALWVTNGNGNGSVSRINPATGVVTRTLASIPAVDAVGAGSLWGTSNYGAIQRADPATGRGDRDHSPAERRAWHLLGRLGLGIE
jgi:DNA-binding beta-propeller fold protein YncE